MMLFFPCYCRIIIPGDVGKYNVELKDPLPRKSILLTTLEFPTDYNNF